MDENRVLDATCRSHCLTVTVVGEASDERSQLDANGVWDKVFDPVTNTVRVVTV